MRTSQCTIGIRRDNNGAATSKGDDAEAVDALGIPGWDKVDMV